MALFTDGIISAIDDLSAHDSGVLEVASSESIDISKKLQLAQDELAVELSSLLDSSDSLRTIVVTTTIRFWHAFQTLEAVYRDAYSNQLNERYGRKRDQYRALAQWAYQKLIDGGLGIARNPVAKADPADLTYVAGQQAGATYYVCNSWVNESTNEGAASDWRAIDVPDNNVLSVRPLNPPVNAAGWNVFIGLSPDTMTQQNESMLATGQVWLQQYPLMTSGRAPGDGQMTDAVKVIPRILQRG